MEQIYVLGACNIGSIQHESHTEISRKRKPRPLLLRDEYTDGNFTPATFKRIGVFTGRLAESWVGSPSCCTFLGWLGNVTSQIRRRVGFGQLTGCPSVAVDSSLILPV